MKKEDEKMVEKVTKLKNDEIKGYIAGLFERYALYGFIIAVWEFINSNCLNYLFDKTQEVDIYGLIISGLVILAILIDAIRSQKYAKKIRKSIK